MQADIGDTIQIADHRHREKVYLSARIQTVQNHYSVEGEDTGVLANYKILTSSPSTDVSDALEELKKQLVTITGTAVSYQVGTSGTEPPAGEWSSAPVEVEDGQYLWTRTVITYSDGSSTTSYSVARSMKGEDAILLQIDSSNGDTFKNSSIATTLTVVIIMGGSRIDTSAKMADAFGPDAYLMWEYKAFGADTFTVIPETDPRLSDNGFIFTIGPQDIDVKAVFNCSLIF